MVQNYKVTVDGALVGQFDTLYDLGYGESAYRAARKIADDSHGVVAQISGPIRSVPGGACEYGEIAEVAYDAASGRIMVSARRKGREAEEPSVDPDPEASWNVECDRAGEIADAHWRG